MWLRWAWWQTLCEVCHRYGGVITDEGIEESIKPEQYYGETFAEYLDRWEEQAWTERQRLAIRAIREQSLGADLMGEYEVVPDEFKAVAFPPVDSP